MLLLLQPQINLRQSHTYSCDHLDPSCQTAKNPWTRPHQKADSHLCANHEKFNRKPYRDQMGRRTEKSRASQEAFLVQSQKLEWSA